MTERLRQADIADVFDPARNIAAEREAALHLHDYGFAPGEYYCRCIDCDRSHIADKRAVRCLPCAEEAFARAEAAERADDRVLMQEKLGDDASDADVLAALMDKDAKLVPFEKDHYRTLFDHDLPDFVRAFVAMNSGPATETMAIRAAGYMPALYATWTPPPNTIYSDEGPIRVRVVMVSRLGDVGISRKDQEHGYFTRVSIYDLTDFDTVMFPDRPARRVHPLRRFAIADKDDNWVRVHPSPAVLMPVAKSSVPVLYETRKAAYKDMSAVDPHGIKGLKIVPLTFTVERDDA